VKSTKVGKKSTVVTNTKIEKQRLAQGLCLTCGLVLDHPSAKEVHDGVTILPFEGKCAKHRTDLRRAP